MSKKETKIRSERHNMTIPKEIYEEMKQESSKLGICVSAYVCLLHKEYMMKTYDIK